MKNPNSLISKSMEQFRPSPPELLRAHILKNYQGLGDVSALPGFGSPAPAKREDAVPTAGQDSKNFAVPPVTERNAGENYPTQMGPMKWTGTGWVRPDAAVFKSGAVLQYNSATKLWRDKATGRVYDSAGEPVAD